MVEVGDIVQAKEWTGDVVTIKVTKLSKSPIHGQAFEGTEMDGGHAVRFRSLPIDRIIQAVDICNVSWGKWDVLFPEGTERVGTKKAARELIIERGYVLGEEVAP